jgi:hypothetical protein
MLELATIRIIADMKTGELSERVAEYLIEDYQDRKEAFEDLAKMPLETFFGQVTGYADLTDEAKETFNKTIMPFSQCQGKGRLTNASIDRIEDREDEKGIRVYMMEWGEEGFQYFYENGQWG